MIIKVFLYLINLIKRRIKLIIYPFKALYFVVVDFLSLKF